MHDRASRRAPLWVVTGPTASGKTALAVEIAARTGREILSIRDLNTFESTLRKKRLMTLIHLYLIHRYNVSKVHYLSPNDDNRYQTEKMKTHGLYSDVHSDVGDIIVASVDAESVADLLDADGDALRDLICKRR